MLSAEARTERDRLKAAQRAGAPLAQRRREWEATARLEVLPRDARFALERLGDHTAEWMEMPRVWKDRVLLFAHGGDYAMGSPRTHRKLAAELSRSLHMRVLTPDYLLAPEHPFPAGIKDLLIYYGWLLKQGVPEERIVFGGDGAGGGMVLSMLLSLRNAGAKLPRAVVLMSPWTDLTCSSPSHMRQRRLDPVMDRDRLLEAAAWYAGPRDPAETLLSPLFAELGGLPPMVIHVGSDEVLLDDSLLFAERAAAAGVTVDLKVHEGLWHGFHHAAPGVPEARQAVDELGIFVRELFRTSTLSGAAAGTV